MYKQEVTVGCRSGLFKEQATLFVQKANEFHSSIHMEYGTKIMNAKSLLGIMFMYIDTGAKVTITAEGPDEQAAVQTLCEMLQRDVC